ncbi:MAG TPA: NapC/NirT family cytochrome c [Anaeromyxobacteraceae bacterium]|nr:NapC/NirT family cytochrome c [Anaeromyxobacteraceae bacterium]
MPNVETSSLEGPSKARRWPTGALLAGAIFGLAAFAVANRAVVYAGTNHFCATACHTMKAADEAYQHSIHFANPTGVRATCSDCHIVNESTLNKSAWQWLQLVAFKARVGFSDVVDEVRGTISTAEKWEAARARLGKQVHSFVKRTDSSTCRGCHDLAAFRAGTMYQLVHGDIVQAQDVDCVSCHSGIAHVYDHPAPGATSTPVERRPSVAKIDPIAGLPGALADVAKLGKQIFVDTPGNALSRPYVGRDDKKSCGTCHRAGGTDLDALPLFGAAAAYPADVDGKVTTLQGRIAECFMRNLDGTHPPLGGKVLVALEAYVTSLSAGKRMNMSSDGGGSRAMRPVEKSPAFWTKADVASGKSLYEAKCSACHGQNGEGGAGPAVWGPRSFSDGASLAKPQKLATYVASAMAAYAGPVTPEQARDIAAFLSSQPRPGFALKDHLPPPDRLGVYEAH